MIVKASIVLSPAGLRVLTALQLTDLVHVSYRGNFHHPSDAHTKFVLPLSPETILTIFQFSEINSLASVRVKGKPGSVILSLTLDPCT